MAFEITTRFVTCVSSLKGVATSHSVPPVFTIAPNSFSVSAEGRCAFMRHQLIGALELVIELAVLILFLCVV